MDLQTYLVLGGYGFSSLVAGFMWREMSKIRASVLKVQKGVEDLRLDLATQRGLDAGQEHERRITRLERILFVHRDDGGES